jgi:hypothetical protein
MGPFWFGVFVGAAGAILVLFAMLLVTTVVESVIGHYTMRRYLRHSEHMSERWLASHEYEAGKHTHTH